MIFFVADTHFNHTLLANIRGFPTKEEHDKFVINIWNKTVSRKDLVYHLGDFCFGDHVIVSRIRARLNGKIILIRGNHDISNRIHNIQGLFTEIHDIKEVKIKDNKTILCHYAMRVWPSSHYNSWQLYGHSHGGLQPIGKQWDIGLENTKFILLTEDDVVKIMKNRPDNVNYLKRHA